MNTKTLFIDSTSCSTSLCTISAKHNTDKSPFSENSVCFKHRKGYTAVYQLLLGHLQNKPFTVCEIGIEQSDSLKSFSEFFKYVELYAMDFNLRKIDKAKQSNIKNLKDAVYTDVTSMRKLNNSFKNIDKKFDVIIDDSTHNLKDMQNIINIASLYLNSGGILIIEDLYRDASEDVFNSINLESFSFNAFIICHHNNRHCWDNDKIWYGIKK